MADRVSRVRSEHDRFADVHREFIHAQIEKISATLSLNEARVITSNAMLCGSVVQAQAAGLSREQFFERCSRIWSESLEVRDGLMARGFRSSGGAS